ncbi:hypothetical protein PsYK624_008120 [Phanerochaete sordida]|uniref:Uncharacterized protein n=1 Tax=Phanerochaete sordida TaxID=48140 RepID=A0A9P3FY73_9APHY|nr:hypothetical protein PsYK624_008120 [Phanerochaete sordida]
MVTLSQVPITSSRLATPSDTRHGAERLNTGAKQRVYQMAALAQRQPPSLCSPSSPNLVYTMPRAKPVGAAKPIPQPHHSVQRTTKLIECMGLQRSKEDRAEYHRIMEGLPEFCREHLKEGLCWGDQSTADWTRFCAAVCEDEPIFRRYQDCWPLKLWTQRYLVNKRHYLKKARKQLRGTPVFRRQVVLSPVPASESEDEATVARSEGDESMDDDDDNVAPPCHDSKSDSDDGSQNPDIKTAVASESIKEESDNVPPPSKNLRSKKPSTPPAAQSKPKVASAKQDPDAPAPGLADPAPMSAFRALLGDLDAVLAANFEKLQLAGIESAEDLQTLMAFPRCEQERLLRQHCGVTKPLELAKICIALDRARAKMEVIEVD